MALVQSTVNDLIHLFFPHVCVGCGSDVLSVNHQLCLKCISKLPATNFFNQTPNPVEKIFYGRIDVAAAASGYFFTKDSLIASLIYELKYKGNKAVGWYMGEKLGYLIAGSKRFSGIDIIIPLPLNARRLQKRGYNQSVVLCEGITSVWSKPVVAGAVVRKVNTETQTHRGRVTRWENMDGVFAVEQPEAIKNKHILLVDDVVTTGASLEACGSEILKAPGTKLSIATLAYTI